MRVQHNIMAMNAYRNYTNNVGQLGKNLEKLSSGYRINRAGDDAAGLAISEKMRAQITGLATAQKNAKDGISLVQTAEGALQEVHDMLNRMYELAEQSANGTYDNEVDRANLQKEFDALRSEIDRIADSSNFNGKNLLDGSLDSAKKVTLSNWTINTTTTPAGSTTGIGTNTILHQNGPDPAKTQFSLDLTDIQVDLATEDDTFTLNVGGVAVTITAKNAPTSAITGANTAAVGIQVASGTSLDGAGLAALLAEKLGSTGLSLEDSASAFQAFSVTASGSTLTFTQNNAPANTDEIVPGAGTITMAVGGTGTMNIGGAAMTGTHNINHTNITQGVAPSAQILGSTSVDWTLDMLQDGNTIKLGDQTYTIKTDANSTVSGSSVVDLTDLNPANANYLAEAAKRFTAAASNNQVFKVGYDEAVSGKITLTEVANQKVADLTTEKGFQAAVQFGTAKAGNGTALTLQIGDTSASYNQLNVSVGDMHVKALGIDSRTINIDSQGLAQTAMDAIKNAINSVSSTRGDLGALQNRLDHTINNLGVMQENIQDAESTVRDVDVAAEMMEYTKNNILIQSAQAMLAQANQIPQGVLQLMG